MSEPEARSPGNHERWPRPTLSIAIAGAALFVSLGGTAVAQKLIDGADIAKGTITSKTIKDRTVQPHDLSATTLAALKGASGPEGSKGEIGVTGASGPAGAAGPAGVAGPAGTAGTSGTNGTNGTNGTHGTNGVEGTDGVDGTNGTDGLDGTDGTNGTNGVIAPVSATGTTVILATATPPTEIVSMAVPAGRNYVVFAKTQLTHSGAGDKVSCVLYSGGSAIDEVAIAPGPALTEAPVSMQAVTTTSTTELSVECDVRTADGTASSTRLVALPIG